MEKEAYPEILQAVFSSHGIPCQALDSGILHIDLLIKCRLIVCTAGMLCLDLLESALFDLQGVELLC